MFHDFLAFNDFLRGFQVGILHEYDVLTVAVFVERVRSVWAIMPSNPSPTAALPSFVKESADSVLRNFASFLVDSSGE